MKKINIEKLTPENFRLFGSYFKLSEAYTQNEIDGDWMPYLFRPDLVTQSLGKTETTAAFSLGLVKNKSKVVDKLQYHSYSEKMILMEKNAVIIFTNINAEETPQLDSAKAILIPEGTAIRLNAGIWHSIPILIDADLSFYMHCAAPRTYVIDSHVYELQENEKFEIV